MGKHRITKTHQHFTLIAQATGSKHVNVFVIVQPSQSDVTSKGEYQVNQREEGQLIETPCVKNMFRNTFLLIDYQLLESFPNFVNRNK